ncbi:MAG TPA: sugar phosphate isomerase/epimerase family protein [Isosphaeraceae bacterium]|jgi:sugar phosphate isomerase/epimerase|nr:sugar phosphate isomerase/epimerase family protein [Isosphaeraceae bacterium]
MHLVMFSKMLQEFPVAEAARRIKAMGFEGVDLTVRPKGHVVPERVELDLPTAVAAIKDQGLTVPMISTAITSASDSGAEATMASAVHENIRLLKLGYWLSPKGKLREAIDRARHELDGLERLAETYHVTFGIHNHSGPGYVNCQPAVIWTLLRDRNPDRIGAYFDPGHAAVEGGNGGWRQALELLAPHLRMVAVKDFGWRSEPGEPKPKWSPQQLPLRDGIVPWPEVFGVLVHRRFDGPVSLHSEYKGPESWRDLSTAALIDQTAADLAFVKSLLKTATE